MMTLTLRELITLLTALISFITLFLTFFNVLRNMSKSIKLVKNVIFGEKGSLNVVDQATLKASMDLVWARIRQNEAVMKMILNEIKEMNRNLLAIMLKLEITIPDINKIVCKDIDEDKRDS